MCHAVHATMRFRSTNKYYQSACQSIMDFIVPAYTLPETPAVCWDVEAHGSGRWLPCLDTEATPSLDRQLWPASQCTSPSGQRLLKRSCMHIACELPTVEEICRLCQQTLELHRPRLCPFLHLLTGLHWLFGACSHPEQDRQLGLPGLHSPRLPHWSCGRRPRSG